jgi:hypothetical protein
VLSAKNISIEPIPNLEPFFKAIGKFNAEFSSVLIPIRNELEIAFKDAMAIASKTNDITNNAESFARLLIRMISVGDDVGVAYPSMTSHIISSISALLESCKDLKTVCFYLNSCISLWIITSFCRRSSVHFFHLLGGQQTSGTLCQRIAC